MNRLFVATLIVLAFGADPSAAQQPSAAAERLQAARERVAEAGIPVELIDSRITEGRVKGIPEERIADAVERRAIGLIRAQEAITAAGVSPQPADLSMGADAIQAGADGPAIRAVVQAAREADRPVALAVLGELVSQGMPVQNARDRVTAALSGRGGRLVDLPQQAAAERARGRGMGRPGGPGNGQASDRGNAGGGPPSGVPASGRPGRGRPDGVGGGRPDDNPGRGR